MIDLFLIAHVVRGEPAFDIATQMPCPLCESTGCDECDEGFWWIIPTSGHRAYPYHYWPFDEFACDSRQNPAVFIATPIELPPAPEGHPDHYQVSASKAKPTGPSLADRLGLNVRQSSAPIRRRV